MGWRREGGGRDRASRRRAGGRTMASRQTRQQQICRAPAVTMATSDPLVTDKAGARQERGDVLQVEHLPPQLVGEGVHKGDLVGQVTGKDGLHYGHDAEPSMTALQLLSQLGKYKRSNRCSPTCKRPSFRASSSGSNSLGHQRRGAWRRLSS